MNSGIIINFGTSVKNNVIDSTYLTDGLLKINSSYEMRKIEATKMSDYL